MSVKKLGLCELVNSRVPSPLMLLTHFLSGSQIKTLLYWFYYIEFDNFFSLFLLEFDNFFSLFLLVIVNV